MVLVSLFLRPLGHIRSRFSALWYGADAPGYGMELLCHCCALARSCASFHSWASSWSLYSDIEL